MVRVARLACLTLIAVALLAAPAAAQAPAVDQYGSAQPTSGVADVRVSGGGSERASARRSDAAAATGASLSAGGAGSATAATVSLRLSFGPASDKLDREIDAALVAGGMPPSVRGVLRKAAVMRFLDSALAGELSDGDAEDVGRAVARLLVDPGPRTPAVLKALLGFAPAVGPATNAVFTRGSVPTGDYAAFQKGLVEGSTDVPRAYAELSAARRSFVEAFDALDVPTVDNIDTPSGKRALVAILVAGAEGNFGSKQTADAKLVDGEVKAISTTTGGAGDGGTIPYLVLALVVLAVLWSVLGLRPRRFARS